MVSTFGLNTFYGQNILQGITGSYDPGSGRTSLGAGMLPMTGIHVGDRIRAAGGEYVVTPADCGATSQLGPTPAREPVALFSHAGNSGQFTTSSQPQERSIQIPFSTEPFLVSASVNRLLKQDKSEFAFARAIS
jgi:hypothetical protein